LTNTFQHQLLTLARQRRRKLVQELAALVGVNPRSVTAWEKGDKTPSDANIAALASALNYPKEYFYGDPPPALTEATFRSLAKMSARQRLAAEAAGKDAVRLDLLIGKNFTRPDPNLPDLREIDPEMAAEALRKTWGLTNGPLPNLVHTMEKNGVRVYSIVHDDVEVDAFSGWSENTPYVFLNTKKTAERSRMDAAHELAHLVLHHHSLGKSKKQEDEAKAFAGAFLMPADTFKASLPRRLLLSEIIEAKFSWGVSAVAYAYRLHELNVIPYWHYRDICIKLRIRYGNDEPGRTIDRESSQVLGKVIGSKGGMSRREIADKLNIPVADLDEITFGLSLTPIQGGQTMQPVPAASVAPRALKLIKP